MYLYITEWYINYHKKWNFGCSSYRISRVNFNADRFWNYPISAEGAALRQQWANLQPEEDSVVGGVFADWLEDNKEYLLAGADVDGFEACPPEQRLGELIQYLRSRLVGV